MHQLCMITNRLQLAHNQSPIPQPNSADYTNGKPYIIHPRNDLFSKESRFCEKRGALNVTVTIPSASNKDDDKYDFVRESVLYDLRSAHVITQRAK